MTADPQWFKSSYSSNGGDCVEVARNLLAEGVVPVRDSKDPQGAVLVFPSSEFGAFVAAVQAGEFGTI
ncbi:DUF397 domain-containing protein [Kitasatospora sp. NPDC015120]|uniref:DUF397 domain-containing protein n=1 Tax=Kitasatospora sp. NPDC015120 TaxID=3364023 RepID=UPI0036F4A1AF